MLVKTSELSGVQLDWAVAQAEGEDAVLDEDGDVATFKTVLGNEYKMLWKASTNWAQGGPIIEREGIDINFFAKPVPELNHGCYATKTPFYANGPTPLIAAMRCYVVSKLGTEVEVPDASA